jgi:nitrate/TMAO reductase-like tetraheme cytochrome c subunit
MNEFRCVFCKERLEVIDEYKALANIVFNKKVIEITCSNGHINKVKLELAMKYTNITEGGSK